jgi:hypothetical protein
MGKTGECTADVATGVTELETAREKRIEGYA